jgi:hypothetical protein
MPDLKTSGAMWLKAVLFVLIGLLSAGLILLECPSWRIALLLCLCVWGFSRAYYFAFYVIERWIDPSYKFSGLWDFALYAWRKRRN